jgi:predicted flap endonuclease-1-like 5' DNA nuclease
VTARRAMAIFVLLLIAAIAPTAQASHYRLPAGGLVSESEERSLVQHSVDTTEALLSKTASLKARRALSKATGLSYARLTELATQCDLLRVRGIGPSVVRLLQAAGTRHAAALRQASPDVLATKIKAANAVHGIMEVLPDIASLTDWIAQARELPKVLEGVR